MTELAEAPTTGRDGTITRIPHWIDGARVDGTSGRSGPVYNPAHGVQTGAVDLASVEEVDAAVQSAQRALPGWRSTSIAKRAELFFAIRELFHAHREDLAKLLTAEHGKVVTDAMGEVARGLEVIEFACGIPTLLKGEFSEQASTGVDVYSIRQPVGVVAGITPFNFPAMVPMWMWAPAVACGNCFILKPSEKDPSASLLTAELLKEAGLPDGVFNVVHGDKVAVDAILEHPGIGAVSFVGSTPIARYIYETGTRHGKRVQALGGAKNHVVVMPDAEMESAVDGVLSSAFHAAGQRCLANSVCVAVGDAYEPLKKRLVEKGDAMIVGEGIDPETEVGPVISAAARERIGEFIERGLAEGGELVLDGRGKGLDDGHFLGPTIIETDPGSECATEEIFGPVLTLVRARDLDHALEIMNASTKGNAASIFTTSGGAMRKFRHDAQAGMIGVNIGVAAPMSFFPFTGWKESFFGDLHAHGRDGIEFYTEKKVVITRWPDA
ncbi:MAG TPA: CoA-acylating methylmalonate-semialdehyde dehydrogenase [Gaiella sp.]